MPGDRVEYATWLEVVLNDARTEVIFRPLSREDFSRSGTGERAADSSSQFHKAAAMPAIAPERPLTLSPNASAKPRICGMRNRPSRLAGQSPEGNLAPPNSTRQPRRWRVPRPTGVKRLPGAHRVRCRRWMSMKNGVYWRSSARIAAHSRGLLCPTTMASAMSVGKEMADKTEPATNRGQRKERRHDATTAPNRRRSKAHTA